MQDETISCPNCGVEIELTEALTGKIRQGLVAEVRVEAEKKQKALEKQAASLLAKEQEIASQKKALDKTVADRLEAERRNLTKEIQANIEKEFRLKNESLEQELKEKSAKLSEAQRKEMNLLKKQRELQERQEALDLEIERKIAEERKAIRGKALEEAAEAQNLKMREKDDLINSLRGKVGDLQRKIEVGSQERQGEALEGELLETLKAHFPFDVFEEISKGVRGADVLQRVRNLVGTECGTILWESKNAKDFSKGWIEKLLKDQQEACADTAVLLSTALPKGMKGFGLHEDLWVTDYASAMSLCAALRQTLIQVSRERLVTVHQDGLKDVIFSYITGPDFSRRVKNIIGVYGQMQSDLDSEKLAMTRIWKKREKQIASVLGNATEMWGEIEGTLGNQKLLPQIDQLSLESIACEIDD